MRQTNNSGRLQSGVCLEPTLPCCMSQDNLQTVWDQGKVEHPSLEVHIISAGGVKELETKEINQLNLSA